MEREDEGIVPSLHMLTASLDKKNSFADGRGCGILTGEGGVGRVGIPNKCHEILIWFLRFA